MKILRFIIFLSLVLAVGPGNANAAGNHNSWDIAVLDQKLAESQSGDDLIQLGDMFFRASSVQTFRDRLAGNQPATSFATASPVTLWPGGMVKYSFNGVSAAHQQLFKNACDDWAAWGNLTFTQDATGNYIKVNDVPGLSGGNSFVGVKGGGSQDLNIGSTSWVHGTLCHEIGHALGLVHEHQRTDRDTYVTVNLDNVIGGASGMTAKDNFVKLAASTNYGAYDYYSVMHYSRALFSGNGGDTIVPVNSAFLNIIGNELDRTLSKLDRAGIAVLYNAPSVAPSAVVTNTKDSGRGSLRTALEYAFDRAVDFPASTTTITFNIPTNDSGHNNGVWTITPDFQMYAPGDRTIIDGTSQPGALTTPRVRFSGQSLNNGGTTGQGLILRAANCTVRGLAINGFNYNGISITGASAAGNTVSGCFIGTDGAGTVGVANALNGIEISAGASNNTIGGTTATQRNVISGNTNAGVRFLDSGTTANVISGNYIGLAMTGMSALKNNSSGVGFSGGPSGNTVGGTAAGSGNVISGNNPYGIYAYDATTSANVIRGNLIGLNKDGTAAVPNESTGVAIYNGAHGTLIGGSASGAGNVISGNASYGVTLSVAGTDANRLEGNIIGLNAAATAKLPNTATGVAIYAGAKNNVVGSAGAGNVIAGNGDTGIGISQSGTDGTVVQGNLIGINAAGTLTLGNTHEGVAIFGQAKNSLIGGTGPGAGNVIAKNGGYGVYIGELETTGHTVQGNFIGTNPAGTAAAGNAFSGVGIFGSAQSNTIGGGVGARNIISGNGNYGVAIGGSGTNSNFVQGNSIGVDVTATVAIPNSFQGVGISGGAQSNTIGGATIGLSNLIAENPSGGIALFNTGTTGNSIRGNSIYNTGTGIYLDVANGAQSAPSLTTAVLGITGSGSASLGATTVNGNMTGANGALYRVEFFATPSGSNQGKTFLGGLDVTTNGGATPFAANLAPTVPRFYSITATATNLTSQNTSAFSGAISVSSTDSDNDGIPDAYESAHGMNSSNSTDATTDLDGDGINNKNEFSAGTNPQSSASAFRISAVMQSSSDITVTFPTVTGKIYRLEISDTLASGSWSPLIEQFAGTGSPLGITDPGATALQKRFYRAVVLP